MKVIRRSAFVRSPWKNGGGVTHEVTRVPRSGEPFRWRVSIANIDASGSFSSYEGYRRHMVLLAGTGMRLLFDDGRIVFLSPDKPIEFDGASAPFGELIDGPCVDLNLMVVSSMRTRVWVASLLEPRRLPRAVDETLLVMGINQAFAINPGDADALHLQPWELLIVPPGVHGSSILAAIGAGSTALVFCAALDDN